MGILPLVVAIAVAWHALMIWLERRLAPVPNRPPLTKLLLTAEIEALRTLKNEVSRRFSNHRREAMQRKLEELDRRLKDAEADAGG